jgi:hypothetical protein
MIGRRVSRSSPASAQNKIDKLLASAENNTMGDLFARYDIWLLMSISGKDEGSGLADIFAAGDGLNRAFFTGEELNRGMSELLHAGFVEPLPGGNWRQTKMAEAFFAAHKKGKRESYIDTMCRLGDIWQATPMEPGCVYAEHFSEKEIRPAYNKYRRKMREVWKRVTGQKKP